jgi:hypothetical protein
MKRRSCKKVLLAPLVCTVTATPIISTGCVYLDQFEQIGITDDNLFFSPNN